MVQPDPTRPAGRKADHLRIAAEPGVEHRIASGLEQVRLRHRALPERDLATVALATELLGVTLAAPLVVSAMTGGTAEAQELNRRLARAAAEHGIALVLGSGRALLEDPALLPTYRAAGAGRPPLLLANLGAAQMREPDGPERAERLVEVLGADGLSVHLNPVQEAVQPEGEPCLRRRPGRHRRRRRPARAAARRRQGGRLRARPRGRAAARRGRRGGRRRLRGGRHELGPDRGPPRPARRRGRRRVRRLGTADRRRAGRRARDGSSDCR